MSQKEPTLFKQDSPTLRQRAERTIQQEKMEISNLSTEEAAQLLHELRVHQIELEMQNDELRTTQSALQQSRDEYQDLYDFAPVGYLTINDKGVIIKANLILAKMVGTERSNLINLPFSKFVCAFSQDRYYLFINRLLEKEPHQSVELKIKNRSGADFDAQLECVRIEDTLSDCIKFRITLSDISARRKAEDQLKATLKEKEILLHEIDHRVKNNMFVILGLLNMQIKGTEDRKAREALQASHDRIQTISLIHRALYQSDNLASIDVQAYLYELGMNLIQGYNASVKIHLKTDIEKVNISVKKTMPIGLIVNELMTNSLKYAFPENRAGEIVLTLKSNNENEVELIVSDNGIGIPENFDLETAGSLGLKLVKKIAENQLDGSIVMENDGGTKSTIKFMINN